MVLTLEEANRVVQGTDRQGLTDGLGDRDQYDQAGLMVSRVALANASATLTAPSV